MGDSDSHNDSAKKRPLIDGEVYNGLKIYQMRSDKKIHRTSKPPNRLIEQATSDLFNQNGDINDGYFRLMMFAEQNDMSVYESLEYIMCRVLDDSGNVQQNFRKPRLFPNDVW